MEEAATYRSSYMLTLIRGTLMEQMGVRLGENQVTEGIVMVRLYVGTKMVVMNLLDYSH